MAQLFSRTESVLTSGLLVAFLPALVIGGFVYYQFWWSPWVTRVGDPINQPVPFSHQHHAGGLGIDCRYCHTTVETAASAGMPSTETCMTCHSQVWRNAPVLQPVRESLRTGKPLQWNRVYDLPDYTYFDHSIHIAKGVGCVSCHGDLTNMPLTSREIPLYMKTCLECHRRPGTHIRPKGDVVESSWPAGLRVGLGEEKRPDEIAPRVDCTACHR